MSVTTEDVAEAVKVLWNANSTLTELVTALILGRLPDPANTQITIGSPYSTYTVTDGPQTRMAGAAYFQAFTVEVTTYDETGAADLGGIKRAIEETLGPVNSEGGGIAPGTGVSLPSGRTLRVMYSLKKPGSLSEDPATQRGQAVKTSKDSYELTCQG